MPESLREDGFPSDSAMGNPSPAQIEALLGPQWFDDLDWKNQAQVDAAYEAHVRPMLERMARRAS